MSRDLPHTIAEAAHLIRTRELSPVDLARATLDRIASIDPLLNAFVTVTADEAMAQAGKTAEEIQRGHYRGALHGVPLSLKDNFLTAGISTTGHSKVYADHVPATSATAADKLVEAGATLVGKNSMHELAHGGPSFDLPWPPARNPWNPSHFTGGSSSGSAAAVAAGMALGALGTDTGGSIMNPAALCGLVGVKPTFGLVSRHGVIPNCFSLDHCGPIARTVEDCAILLDAIVGHDPKDRSSIDVPRQSFRASLLRDLSGKRVGVVRQFGREDAAANDDTREATENAARLMKELGATLTDIRLRPLSDYYDVWTIIEAPETFAIQRQALIDRPDEFGSVFLTRTLIACLISAADYVAAQQVRSLMISEIDVAFGSCDILICPGAGPAPVLEPRLASWPHPNRSVPFTLGGYPMVAVPTGLNSAGLPVSIQIIGKPLEDAGLLGVAYAYEQASGWSQRRPPPLERPPAAIDMTARPASPGSIDSTLVTLCEEAARRMGLELPERPLTLLCEAAPRMMGMIERLRGAHRSSFEPANTFFAASATARGVHRRDD